MPLNQKGHKILSQMRRQYGYEEGNRVFNAAKNAGKIAGVERTDDNQHLGITNNQASSVEKFVSAVDSLTYRLDAFEKRKHQKQPEKVKPRTKDYMQPSNPHPKEVG
jgi:hypothetical protein